MTAFLSFSARGNQRIASSSWKLSRSFVSSSSTFPDETDCHLFFPINIMDNIKGSDWENRIALQSKWSNREKGWQVNVEWKTTPIGVGLFCCEDIPAGTILRIGTNGYNLMQFRNVQDIEAFCQEGNDDKECQARLNYVKDYLWGYSPNNTDEQGYDLSPSSTCDRFFGMWIPGNGLNHSPNPNTVYRTRKGGTEEGIVLVSLCDIAAGEELYDDYRRHGQAPQWLFDFAQSKQVTLNFAGCNDFVDDMDNSQDQR